MFASDRNEPTESSDGHRTNNMLPSLDYECSMGYKYHNFRNVCQTRVLVISGTKMDDQGWYNEDTSSFEVLHKKKR